MDRIYQTVSAEAAAHLQIRRGIIAALCVSLVTNAALALTLLTRTDTSRTVVLSPASGIEYIAQNDAVSANLMERFAAESTALLLNLTPSTAQANAEAFLKHVEPRAYAAIAARVRTGASEIVRNYASSVFYPQTSAVDADARVVCFTGERQMMIGREVTQAGQLTVCMRHLVTAGRLQVTQLWMDEAKSSEAARELVRFKALDAGAR